jgi:ribosomal protein S18 acetylase RimI-like enzyme
MSPTSCRCSTPRPHILGPEGRIVNEPEWRDGVDQASGEEPGIEIRRLGAEDAAVVLAAAELFDEPPRPGPTERFLAEAGHHLLVAFVADRAAGFVSGVETTHPDKGTEMFLYELGVAEAFRGRGIGVALVGALRDLAVARGCHGMWVGTDRNNAAALATYRAAGAGSPEDFVMLTWDLATDPG